MKDNFASYEIALKLKELGFNKNCLGYYLETKELRLDISDGITNLWLKNNGGLYIAAPLWQQVIDWFRIKHSQLITIMPILINASNKFGHRFSYSIIDLNDYSEIFDETPLGFLTYEEARNAALLKVIKICKKNL